MNGIQASINQSYSSIAVSGSGAQAAPAEEKRSADILDGVTLTGASAGKESSAEGIMSRRPSVAAEAEKTAGSGASPMASADQAFTAAGKIAASTIGGVPGHALGITVDALKDNQKEIEKGYHLPENYICAYYERRILPYLEHPTYKETDEFLYRGMYITVDDLANILDKGFETKYNTWQAAGGKGIYMSSSEREADDYIFQSTDFRKKNALGVVFKMEKGDYAQLVDDPKLNSTNTIYKSSGDVPSDKIVNIYLRGEYGLESLGSIIDKAKAGGVRPNQWVHQFDSYMNR